MLVQTMYAAGALAFAAVSQAHVVMNKPTPYGLSTLQSSPLNGAGYNFPCQSGSRAGAYDATGVYNPMVVGQDNLLNFTGSAVHGGGSCQLSVTYEHPPPADKSKWKVIKSYIGACPASATGNIATGDPSADEYGHATGVVCKGADQTECLKQYYFQIPEGMKNGNATLAWTWFNKVGNREMYMNCAPISISGGSDDDTYYNSLPEIFVANIPGECHYEDRSAVVGFPNPGNNVVYGEAVTRGSEGSCPKGAADGSPGSSSAAPSSSAASTSSAAPTYAAPTSYAASSPSYAASSPSASSFALSLDVPYLTFSAEGNAKATAEPSSISTTTAAAAGNVETVTVHGEDATINYTTMVTVTASAQPVATSAAAPSAEATSAEATSAAAPSVASSAAASATPTAPVSNNYSSASGSCDEGKVACSSPGNIVCIDETHFGLCNIDNCAVPEALAHGTSCSEGVINASVVARRSNRQHRHAAGHLNKRNF